MKALNFSPCTFGYYIRREEHQEHGIMPTTLEPRWWKVAKYLEDEKDDEKSKSLLHTLSVSILLYTLGSMGKNHM